MIRLEHEAPGYFAAVEWCLDFWFQRRAGVGEAARAAFRQECKKYLRSYYAATIENLDQFGLTKVITPEELRQLCLFKLLYPSDPNLESAGSFDQCGSEIGIQHSRRDFDRNLSICVSFAYRRGVHDELKDQEKRLGRERRAEIEQFRRELSAKIQTQVKPGLVTEAYTAGRKQARCAIGAQKCLSEIHLDRQGRRHDARSFR